MTAPATVFLDPFVLKPCQFSAGSALRCKAATALLLGLLSFEAARLRKLCQDCTLHYTWLCMCTSRRPGYMVHRMRRTGIKHVYMPLAFLITHIGNGITDDTQQHCCSVLGALSANEYSKRVKANKASINTCSCAALAISCILTHRLPPWLLLPAQCFQVRWHLHSFSHPDGALPKQLSITTKGCPGSLLIAELDEAKAPCRAGWLSHAPHEPPPRDL